MKLHQNFRKHQMRCLAMAVENFIFYKSWADELDKMDKDKHDDFTWRIVEYGIFEREDFEGLDPFAAAWLKSIYRQIDIAKEKYDKAKERGQIGGRRATKDTNQKVKELLDRGITKGVEIAEIIGVTKQAVYATEAWRTKDLGNQVEEGKVKKDNKMGKEDKKLPYVF